MQVERQPRQEQKCWQQTDKLFFPVIFSSLVSLRHKVILHLGFAVGISFPLVHNLKC